MRITIACVLLFLAAGGVPSGCAAGPDSAALSQKVVVVDEKGIHPAPEVELEPFGSILWLNGFTGGQKIRVTVDRPIGPSDSCVTRLGFEDKDGSSRSPELDANQGSALCFHDAGQFAYEIEVGDRRLTGRVLVAKGNR